MNFSDQQRFRSAAAKAAYSEALGPAQPLEDRMPWIGLSIMVIDFIVVVALGMAVDTAYHLLVYGKYGSALAPSFSLAVAFLYTAQQALAGRYRTSDLVTNVRPVERLARDWMVVIMVILIIGFLLKEADVVSRGAFVLFALAGLPVIIALRGIGVLVLKQAIKTERLRVRRIVLIGKREEIERYFNTQALWLLGINVAASVIMKRGPDKSLTVWTAEDQREIPDVRVDELAMLLRPLQADDIVLALPWAAAKDIETFVEELIHLPTTIYLAPDPCLDHLEQNTLAGTSLSQAMTDRASGLVGLKVISRPLTAFDRITKRAFDIVASAAGIIVLMPLALLICLAIVIESPGNPFYRQRRNGFNEKTFSIFKFRSMRPDSGGKFKQTARNDPRITRVGRFLRRTNLDELPQLINVLAGDMSLVGPRPLAVEHNDAFMSQIERYARRHHVKPGITGWAQINGLRGSAEDRQHMSVRIAHDLEYIGNWSLWLDIKIIILTLTSRKAFHNAF